jgi:competence CoiA-like predicted nuclease
MVSRAFVNGSDYTIWGDSVDRSMLVRARRNGKIACHCGKPLTFVDATVKIPHFRHLHGNCLIIGAERDTETHNEGLEYLGQLLRTHLDGIATIEKEKTLSTPDGLRRTDIFAAFRDGRTVCYELQCSHISEGEFAERESAY